VRALAAAVVVVACIAAEFGASYVHMPPGHHWAIATTWAFVVFIFVLLAGEDR
jgi:membrane protein YdbS with pleckstrin-like domain